MDREEAISRDPEVLGGPAVCAGTRVPVQTLIDYLKVGDNLDDFLDGFPSVSREQAEAFLQIAEDNAFAEAIREGQQTEQAGGHELFGERNRHESLHDAQGMWKDRDDLPDFEALRRELDEFRANGIRPSSINA